MLHYNVYITFIQLASTQAKTKVSTGEVAGVVAYLVLKASH
jgi:hypothetical protein